MSARNQRIWVAAVIATQDRPRLLSERSLKSVAAQTHIPDLLVVVDDSEEHTRSTNAAHVASLALDGSEFVYVESNRTSGVSGSWNSAIDVLMERGIDAESVFVAFLDDDDSWSPEYVETCINAACDRNLDMVATGIHRFEAVDGHPQICEPPDALRAEDFLIGNPGIQGSNLFIRLSSLLEAGGFDESLPSTTDRDLCIRLADLGSIRYGRVRGHLVRHYAEPERPRLSSAGSPCKFAGLSTFWLKHSGRMSTDQRRASVTRANAQFHWTPADAPSSPDSLLRRSAATALGKAPSQPSYQLFVGVVSSDPVTLAPLLRGLAALDATKSIDRVVVLILNNGCPADHLGRVIRGVREAGLEVVVIDVGRQRDDAEEGVFGPDLNVRPFGQVGIAQARTMLQRYLGALMASEPGSIGWVLDDDMRIDHRAASFLSWLPAFRDRGIDVLIGACEGSSPNPPLNGLRVQLVDLLHNVQWLRYLPADSVLPDRTAENDLLRSRYPDYYYDLSRKHTGHLEMPHWLEPAFPGELVGEAYSRLLANAPGILSGQPLTRPIIVRLPADPVASAEDSVNRGGCTFILNHRALCQTPNTMLRVHGREARRSDMIWAIVNRYYRDMTIKAVGFPVHHAGRLSAKPVVDVQKTQSEIVGSTLYAGLTWFLTLRPDHRLNFTHAEAEEVCQSANRSLRQRLRLLTQSVYRMAGLREALRRLADEVELKDLVCHLDQWITPENLDQIRVGAQPHQTADVEEFLMSLRRVADEFASVNVNIDFIRAQLGAAASQPHFVTRRPHSQSGTESRNVEVCPGEAS